jgi:plasmid replication initiation protein
LHSEGNTDMTPPQPRRRYQDGRDEMNLADFPISVLQRQQPSDASGQKLDTIVYESSRLDPASRQRVTQRVTLQSSSREGLPTPADEHVILALLYVAKHSTNFADATVHFAPGQLFEIMGWSPNGRSYQRLRGVLRRLKSLNVRYENAWWDAAGRAYEEEVATGIIAAYRIARQVSGPRREAELQSWVTWTPQFHESLQKGNIKRLDLELFFSLRSPTAQRMYRFLDKRFYNTPRLSLDLVEFACGHVGLTECDNVAVLKRRLAPAITELEEIGFLRRADPEERYQKVKAGVWRVHFQKETAAEALEPEPAPMLVTEFYRLRGLGASALPGPRDLEQAQALLREHGEEKAKLLLPHLAAVVRKEWPDCRSFSGAAQKYLADARQLLDHEQHRQTRREDEQARRRQEIEDEARRREEQQQFRAAWSPAWQALPDAEREAVRQAVLARHPHLAGTRALLEEQCLRELARRGAGAAADGRHEMNLAVGADRL